MCKSKTKNYPGLASELDNFKAQLKLGLEHDPDVGAASEPLLDISFVNGDEVSN